jgi:hypothetical protein
VLRYEEECISSKAPFLQLSTGLPFKVKADPEDLLADILSDCDKFKPHSTWWRRSLPIQLNQPKAAEV